jgi:hypothetical protein
MINPYELIDLLKEDEYSGRLFAIQDCISQIPTEKIKKIQICCKTEQDSCYNNHYLPELIVEFYDYEEGL